MKRFPVWMDCDTGTDDAVAIMLAHALDEIDLLGISCVSGNTSHDNVFRNTHYMNEVMGTSYPVYPGSEIGLMDPERNYAAAFHGANGMGDVETYIPENAVINEKPAWDAIYECAKAQQGELNLIATGPLTNVAIAFMKYPDLPKLLKQVLIMGGSASYGNTVPAAEFNIYADPESAAIVFRSGVKLVMCGLDVTLQGYFTPEDLDELAASGKRTGIFMRDILQKGLSSLRAMGFAGVSMHDSCPVLYLVHPEIFGAVEAGVVVETRGTITNGRTVTDIYSDKQFGFKNATVVLNMDRDIFVNTVKEKILSIS